MQGMLRGLEIAGIGVAHPNKGSATAADKVMGSKAWRSVPRSVVYYSRPQMTQKAGRVVAVSKANLAARRQTIA